MDTAGKNTSIYITICFKLKVSYLGEVYIWCLTLKEFVQSKSKSALLYTDLRVPETESENYLSTPLT